MIDGPGCKIFASAPIPSLLPGPSLAGFAGGYGGARHKGALDVHTPCKEQEPKHVRENCNVLKTRVGGTTHPHRLESI